MLESIKGFWVASKIKISQRIIWLVVLLDKVLLKILGEKNTPGLSVMEISLKYLLTLIIVDSKPITIYMSTKNPHITSLLSRFGKSQQKRDYLS